MVKYIDFAVVAARQARRKRLRLLLTALGIAIGVAAVVSIIALGEGIRDQSVEMIREQSDLTLVEVSAGTRDGTFIPITGSKAAAIAAQPHVSAAAAVAQGSFATREQTYLGVIGIRADEFAGVFDPVYLHGGAFAPGSRDAVLGNDIAGKLQRYEGIRFGDELEVLVREYDESGLPDDRTLTLRIAGVLQQRDDDLDNAVLMDRSVLLEVLGGDDRFDLVYVRADSPEYVFSVADEIAALGLDSHGAFEEIESVNRLMDIVVLVLSFFTGISLVVGALMIINTMMISVYERIREIGITMAIGASGGDVVQLILFECLYIGILGGILGDLAGIGLAGLINTVGKGLVVAALGDTFAGFRDADITLITPGLLLTGMIIAVALSLLAGLYPAMKAARLNPVDAMRRS